MSRLESALQSYNVRHKKKELELSGLLGLTIGGSRQVNVANRDGFVYVRLRDSINEVIQARNDIVSPVYNLPVIVTRFGNNWRVTGRDLERYNNWGTTSSFLSEHGYTHEFDKDGGNIGGDIVFVHSDQFTPALVYPSGTPGGVQLAVSPYVLHKADGTFTYVGNTGTISFLPYVPKNNSAIMGLVYMDKRNGSIGVMINSGSPFSASITGTSYVVGYLPTLTDINLIPLKGVRLVSGTTYLSWDNLYDVRQLLDTKSSGTSGGGLSALYIQDEGVAKGTAQTLNFVGSTIDVSISGSVARVFVTGSASGGVSSGTYVPSSYGVADSVLITNSSGTVTTDVWFKFYTPSRHLLIGNDSPVQGGNNTIEVLGTSLYPGRVVLGGFDDLVTVASPTLETIGGGGFPSAPTRTLTNKVIGLWHGIGLNDANELTVPMAKIQMVADADWDSANSPAHIDFYTTNSGTNSPSLAMSITKDGKVNIGSGKTYNVNGQPHTHAPLQVGAIPRDGWIDSSGTWSYSSLDTAALTGVISVNVDLTNELYIGDRISYVQSGSTKYGLVTAKSAFSSGTMTFTFFYGQNTAFANAAITSPKYSHVKNPTGFPLDQEKWTVLVTDTSDRTQASPTAGTYYQPGSLAIVVPIGRWRLGFTGVLSCSVTNAQVSMQFVLSTGTASISDNQLVGYQISYGTTVVRTQQNVSRLIALTAKTTYNLLVYTGSAGVSSIAILPSSGVTTKIYAESTLL